MERSTICAAALLGVLTGLCACSQQETPRTMAQRFARADSVLITNSVGQSLSLTPEETKNLIHALRISEKQRGDFSCSPGTWVGFFSGTNFLGSFNSCQKLFWLDQGPHPGGWRKVVPYFDNTGTLETLEARLRQQEPQA